MDWYIVFVIADPRAAGINVGKRVVFVFNEVSITTWSFQQHAGVVKHTWYVLDVNASS